MQFGKAQGGGLIALGLMLLALQVYILFSSTQPSGSPTQAPALPTRGEQITKFVPGVVGLLALAVGEYLVAAQFRAWDTIKPLGPSPIDSVG
jgi:hypothetical protein